MNEVKLKKLLDNYKKNQSSFKGLKVIGNSLISLFIRKSQLKIQSKKSRLKSLRSLRQKLASGVSSPSSIKKIQDLVGFRLVYMLEGEVRTATKELREFFGFDNTSVKFKLSNDDYNAIHVIVKIKTDKIQGIDTKSYKGYNFEIQLTTSLYDTWATISHEICYKRSPELSEMFAKETTKLDQSLNKVMEDHLKEANYKLEDTYKYYQEISNAFLFFKKGTYKRAYLTDTYSEALDVVKNTIDYLRNYEFENKSRVNYLNFLKRTASKWKQEFESEEYPYVSMRLVEIAGYVSPLDFETYFDFIFLLKTKGNKRLSDECSKKIISLADYGSWNSSFGLAPQAYLLNYLSVNVKRKSFLNQNVELVRDVLTSILKLTFEFTNMSDFRTMSIQRKVFKYSEKLEELRYNALVVYQDVLLNLSDERGKIDFFRPISYEIKRNYNLKYDSELKRMCKKHFIIFFEYSVKNVRGSEFLFRRKLESFLESKSIAYFRCKQDINNIRKKYLKETVENKLFYRITFNYDNARQYEGIDELIRENVELGVADFVNFDEATQIKLLNCFQLYWNYGVNHYYPGILMFYGYIGELLPYLQYNSRFSLKGEALSAFMRGVNNTQSSVDSLIVDNISDQKSAMALIDFIFDHSQNYTKYLRLIVRSHSDDQQVLNYLIQKILWKKINTPSVKKLFIETIKTLTVLQSSEWPSMFFEKNDYFNSFSNNDIKIIIKNSVYYQKRGYHLGILLSQLAKPYPDAIIDFFEISFEKSSDDRFYSYELKNILYKNISAETQRWSIAKYWSVLDSDYEVKAYFQSVFSICNKAFNIEVLNFLRDKVKEGEIDNTIRVLREYSGSSQIHDIVREIVVYLDNKNNLVEYKGELFHLLEFSSGVVTGEFGTANRIKAVGDAVDAWEEESSPIKKFKQEFLYYIRSREQIERYDSERENRLEQLAFSR